VKIVAVTACATGIAHTYMAAEMLEKTAQALGHEITVETQGAMGIEHPLPADAIRAADVVILATDIGIEHAERFDDAPIVLRVPVRDAIADARSLFLLAALKLQSRR
jgi:fructose-specific phosphotransferase system IIB component